MKRVILGVVGVLLAGALVGLGVRSMQAQQETTPPAAQRFLYIEDFEVAPGQVPSEAVAAASEWVRAMRATGEFESVKLYMHHTGPRFALYVLAETSSWQAINDGFEKMFEAMPDWMDRPYEFGTHSDNLLSEIPVN